MQPHLIEENLLRLLSTRPPVLSITDAAGIAADYFGIHASAQPLTSHRDLNFRLDTPDRRCFILKITNPTERLESIDFQNCALRHVAEQDATIPIPRVIPALDSRLFYALNIDGKTHIVRVLSWLEGTEMDDTLNSASQAVKLGGLLARLDLALHDFKHPASNPELLWDMKRASRLREILFYMQASELYELVGRTLNRFDERVRPGLQALRTQVIFNDMHPGNVLIDASDRQKISGIIDFGDLVNSPLIIDLAVAAAYQLAQDDDPLAGALPLIAGYYAVCPVQESEMRLLVDLIRVRLATTLIISTCMVSFFPENKAYLMSSYAAAGRSLVTLSQLDEVATFERIAAACV
jgi:hydroxylysine kinase